MLAVSRSCRETRFLLHARDTVLLYSIGWGFPLEDPAFRDLWAETIEAQSRHDENHEDQWDNALRYALAVAMGCRNQSLNKRTPQELLKTSLRTLLDSSSPNGLFAGQLDGTTKNPICFLREEDRDFHFHCTFEIPYILLLNASKITQPVNENAQKRPNTEVIISTTPTHGYMGAADFFDIRPDRFNIEGNNNLFPPGYQAAGAPGQMLGPFRRPAVFKKRQPFYHLMDSTNIIEIEEEWLYNYPAFLDDRSVSSEAQANVLMMTYLLEGIDLREALRSILSSSHHEGTLLTIVKNDEGLQKALSGSLTDTTQERRRILAQMILHISRDESIRKGATGLIEDPVASQRLREVYELLHPVLLEFEKISEFTPEKADTIHGAMPTATEAPRRALVTQSSTWSNRWLRPGRTQSSPVTAPTPGKATEKVSGPEDPGVAAVEELMEYHEMKERLKTIMRQNIDVFGAIGIKVTAFTDRVAAILDEDSGMLARILLTNKSLYKELRTAISRKVENGSRIRQEIHRYVEILLSSNDNSMHTKQPPDDTGLHLRNARPSSDSNTAIPLGVPDRVDFDNHCGAFVSDTSKKLSSGRGQKAQDSEYNEYAGRIIPNMSLWHDVLKKPREPKKAKKRFVWLPEANPTTALVCFLGSPQVERDPMNLFFDRHSDYELYFFDDTTPHLNTWETELHISFYQILQPGQSQPTGIPKPFRATFLGKDSCELTKASMGFRFFGDFFDRYWTCHFIEYLPSDNSEKLWNFPFDGSNSRSTINGEWRQRKVLELYLFERIVTKVVSSTREIYELVRQELGVGGETFSMVALYLDSDDYFSSSEHWQKCQEALQVIEDQLEHIATEIAKWESRERSRGQEKPRWTRRDERKYSGAIKKRLGACNSIVRDLRRLKADITVRKQLLISRQDQIRNDLSLNSAENIRFFTYVTVVFLPLGFSASIFSMSEVPDGQLIGEMAIVAAIALILTAVALATYGMSRKLPRLSETTVKRSQFVKNNNKKRDIRDDVENSGGPSAATQIAKKKTIWFIGFWLTYAFVEKPLGWVILGLDVMYQPKWNGVSVFSIAVALCLLPYCLLVCVVRVLAYNTMDLARHLWGEFTPAQTHEEEYRCETP
ncbi:hypothetical protein PG996_007824 [Apiospora saccharicola]|uniref:Uncharacterized protein n=1 Tax=Apiospora saccharicola TaxID=335842 RepID=A0ABR1UWX8_9PEZI